MGCVYKLSFPNGKAYIGMTTKTAAERFKRHIDNSRSSSTLPVHNAIRKYGVDSISLEVVYFSDNLEELKKLEIKTIEDSKNSHQLLYNLTLGGDGVFGWSPSLEQRERIRRRLIGNRNAFGSKWSLESKEKRSKSLKGNQRATGKRWKFKNKRKSVSEKFRAKRSVLSRGSKNPSALLSEATVLRIKEWLLQGYKQTEIADLLNLSQGHISNIATDKAWSHVPWPLDVTSRDD